MPTGYTADVQSGKVVEFSDFALQCARAFGALIMMRDDPADATIPEKFEPHLSYNDTALAAAEARLAELRQMTPEQAEVAAQNTYDASLKAFRERKAERAEQRARYEAMLAKVRAWMPPTEDHHGLRDFMVQQLSESIRFDCSGRYDDEPTQPTPEAWLSEELQRASRDVAYHTEARADEIERTNGRNKWLADLRASLEASS